MKISTVVLFSKFLQFGKDMLVLIWTEHIVLILYLLHESLQYHLRFVLCDLWKFK